MSHLSEETINNLKYLRLHYTATNSTELLRDHGGDCNATFLENLLRLEIVEKKSRSIQLRMTQAKLGRFQRMHNFDWNWPKAIEKDRIEGILDLNFLTESQNVILIGAQGLGKTMIAKNILCNAINRGYRGLFTTASRMVADLIHNPCKTEVVLKKYLNTDILVIDELGYLSFEQKAADILFEVVSGCYQRKPIIMTTNMGFRDWPQIFPGAACVTAMVDRLTHDAEILKITGQSFRTKNRLQK